MTRENKNRQAEEAGWIQRNQEQKQKLCTLRSHQLPLSSLLDICECRFWFMYCHAQFCLRQLLNSHSVMLNSILELSRVIWDVACRARTIRRADYGLIGRSERGLTWTRATAIGGESCWYSALEEQMVNAWIWIALFFFLFDLEAERGERGAFGWAGLG